MKTVFAKGSEIPCLGLGTYQLKGSNCQDIVERALAIGYTHIDTAQMYANEKEVGLGIKASRRNRDDYFLTTKVWHTNLYPDKFARSVEASLTQLRVDYVDLLLIHWPNQDLELEVYIEELVRAKEQGKAKYIGISNFTPELIQKTLELGADVVNNQVEYHPYLDQSELLSYCKRQDISLTAYSPLAQGKIIKDDLLKEIGKKYGKSAAQVGLRWLIQQEKVIAIPKTSSFENLQNNIDLFDFELSQEEMDSIFDLTKTNSRIVNPSFGPDW